MIRQDGIILPLMDSIMQERYLSDRKSGLESPVRHDLHIMILINKMPRGGVGVIQ